MAKLFWHWLLINRNSALFWRNKNKKYIKGYGFVSFARKYKKQWLDTELVSLKTASKKVVHKTGKF